MRDAEPATHVEVTDYLPVDYCVNFTNITNSGIFLGDRIIWTDVNLEPVKASILDLMRRYLPGQMGSML